MRSCSTVNHLLTDPWHVYYLLIVSYWNGSVIPSAVIQILNVLTWYNIWLFLQCTFPQPSSLSLLWWRPAKCSAKSIFLHFLTIVEMHFKSNNTSKCPSLELIKKCKTAIRCYYSGARCNKTNKRHIFCKHTRRTICFFILDPTPSWSPF